MLRPLRARQSAAIEEIRKAVREGHRRIVLQAPTGFGKTLTAAHIVDSSAKRGNRPMFTVPAVTLVNQTLKAFEFEGIKNIGVIQAQHERTDFEAQIQIASVQTLIRRALPEVHIVLIDECHLQFKKLNEKLDSEEWQDKIVIGLSATPWTKSMGLRWSKLIIAATIQELIDEKLLAPFVIFGPKYKLDVSGVKIVKGEYEDDSAAKLVNTDTHVGDVIETWFKHRDAGRHAGDRTFLFAQNRAHARHHQEAFIASGVSCGYIDAFTDGNERKDIFDRFRSSEYKIISSVGCLTTGVDEDVRCIIDDALTRDEKKHVQKIGRGLRIAPGKGCLLILDHAGNNWRLGTVTDIYHDHLDVTGIGSKGDPYPNDKKPSKPKKCKNCGAAIGPGKPICGFCFHKVVEDHGVDKEEGELVLFKSGKVTKKEESMQKFLDSKGLKMYSHYGFENMEKIAKDHGYTGKQTDYLNQQAWYSGFLAIAQERGHNSRWADFRFKEKFKEFPMRLRKEPASPSLAIRAFDHHCRIKRAKSAGKSNIPTA